MENHFKMEKKSKKADSEMEMTYHIFPRPYNLVLTETSIKPEYINQWYQTHLLFP
jgi:hypothetical protein